MLALLLALPHVYAADAMESIADLNRQYEILNMELEQAIQDIEHRREVSAYPERMLSYRNNATVAIGGELRTTYTFSSGKAIDSSAADPLFANRQFGKSKLGDLDVSTAKITIDARANRWRAHLDLNLNGYTGLQPVDRVYNRTGDGGTGYERRNREFWVSEAYIELLKDGHSGFGFKAGLMELPFGLTTRPNLVGRSFLDAPNLTGSYLNRPYSGDTGQILPHASRLLNPAVALMASYEMRDIIRFEAAIFQDNEHDRWTRTRKNGYDRVGEESTVPLSHQIGFSILPLEGWELSATYRNRHSRSRGLSSWTNSPYRSDFGDALASGGRDPAWDEATGQWSDTGTGVGFGSRRNEQAFAVGLAIEIPNTMLAVQLEYAHGWNQGFSKHINSDNVNFGLAYRLTPRLTLYGQAEWLHVKDRSWMAQVGAGWTRDTRNHRLYRALLGAEYELFRGLIVEAGWQYEYWNYSSSIGDSGGGSVDRTLTANMFYMGTRFLF